ncbi:MAG: HD domain-containing protein [Bacilli bacterium]|nr:HD domain-containing protein [Bacilli bacterium]
MEKEKLYNILLSDNVVTTINDNLDFILTLIPELKALIGFEHNHPHHHLDVWNHTLLTLNLSPSNFEIRLVLLLHDIGKPNSYQDEEVRHFREHTKISSNMSFNILKRLNFNEDEIFKLCYLIEQHDTLITDEEIDNNKKLATIKFKIQCCDALAHNPTKLEKRIKYLLDINEKINTGKEKDKCKKLISKISKEITEE